MLKFFLSAAAICVLAGATEAQAANILKCESHSGLRAKAQLMRLDAQKYQLRYRLGNQESVERIVSLDYQGTRFGHSDSPYGESTFIVKGKNLNKNLVIRYISTSDGPDTLHFQDKQTQKYISNLTCL